jgi:hypothetical protein
MADREKVENGNKGRHYIEEDADMGDGEDDQARPHDKGQKGSTRARQLPPHRNSKSPSRTSDQPHFIVPPPTTFRRPTGGAGPVLKVVGKSTSKSTSNPLAKDGSGPRRDGQVENGGEAGGSGDGHDGQETNGGEMNGSGYREDVHTTLRDLKKGMDRLEENVAALKPQPSKRRTRPYSSYRKRTSRPLKNRKEKSNQVSGMKS